MNKLKLVKRQIWACQFESSSGTVDRRNVKEIVIKNASDSMFGAD
nr:hypothetical protein [Rhizobium laguerreae]